VEEEGYLKLLIKKKNMVIFPRTHITLQHYI
jgi:hypothetical protein